MSTKSVVRVIIPILVFYLMTLIVEVAAGAGWAFRHAAEYISGEALDTNRLTEDILAFSFRYAMLMQLVATILSSFILVPMFISDFMKRTFDYVRKYPPIMMVLLVPAGALAAISGNLLMNLTDWTEISQSFEQAQEALFSGPLIFQVLGIGLIIPIGEELVFRGLVYMRIRQVIPVYTAMALSALIFSLLHGNPVQGMYAFVLGILLAYVYETFGTLFAPIIVHLSANVAALSLGLVFPYIDSVMVMLAAGLLLLVPLAGLILLIDKKVVTQIQPRTIDS